MPAVVADFTNAAQPDGEDSVANVVTDEDDVFADVIAPQNQIEASPDTVVIGVGVNAVFDLTVTNPGDTALVDAVVTDALVPARFRRPEATASS